MKSFLRKEVLIGVLVIITLLILFFGINFLKGVNLFKAANYYYAVYDNVEGLAQSAPVTLNGYKVGIVREIQYQYNNPGHVAVEISVDKALRLPKGSKAVLASDLLGTASISLVPGNSIDGEQAVGDTLIGVVNKGMMAGITDNLLPTVGAILPKIDSLLSNLNTLTANENLHKSIDRLDEITTDLQASIHSLRGVMASLQPIAGNIRSITSNVDTITDDLSVVTGRLRNAPIDSITVDLRETMANLERLTAALNNPDGTIGKLTTDPQLYENLNATVASLDSLFIDIKRNPKRYVTIKVF